MIFDRLTSGPVFVDVGFVLELLGQVVQTLKAHHLAQQPFFERLLGDLQALPSSSDVLIKKTSFRTNHVQCCLKLALEGLVELVNRSNVPKQAIRRES